MDKYRVTVDKRVDGKTVESETSAEMENYIGMLFCRDKNNPKSVNGEVFIKGGFGEMEIHVFANMCADALFTMTEDRSNAPLIWDKFIESIRTEMSAWLENETKEKEKRLYDSLLKIGVPGEEIDKMLDMIKKAAEEGAEALRASRRKENGCDDSAEKVDELFRKFVAEKDGQEAAGKGGD